MLNISENKYCLCSMVVMVLKGGLNGKILLWFYQICWSKLCIPVLVFLVHSSCT